MLLTLLFQPSHAFEDIAKAESPEAVTSILRYALLILLLPPLSSWIGAHYFGWRLGSSEPVFFDATGEVLFAFFYFALLSIGLIGTALISSWMSDTYGASSSTSLHFAFLIIICTPLAVASMAHLFPNVFFNVLILLPTLLWSITLLYKGIPVVFNIPPERGMLMASALVGWLMVAAVSLLGLSVALWTNGAASALGL